MSTRYAALFLAMFDEDVDKRGAIYRHMAQRPRYSIRGPVQRSRHRQPAASRSQVSRIAARLTRPREP